MRERVKQITPNGACHEDPRDIIAVCQKSCPVRPPPDEAADVPSLGASEVRS